MERYVINGTEIEYDTFDLDNMERLEAASEKVRAAVGARSADESSIAGIRRNCEAMLHFFDEVLGEGAAHELFGDRVNFRIITEAYRGFHNDVRANIAEVTGKAAGLPPVKGAAAASEARPGTIVFRGNKIKS